MSILDANPLLRMNKEQLETFKENYDLLLGEAMKEAGLDETAAWRAIGEGATLSAGLGLDEAHLEALYGQAFDLLHNGDNERARSVFLTLVQLDPHEPKYVYGFAASYQLAGEPEKAAHLYVTYIPMDATNPEGYLRLGECLRAVGDNENAHACFEIAAMEAERGNGRPGAAAYARRHMAELRGTF